MKTACWKSACMGKHKTRTRHWTVWHRILTEVYISGEILEMGLYDAVAYFDIGISAV